MFLIARCCVVTTNDLVEQSMSFLTYPPKNAKSKSKIEFILIKSQAHCAERWQSGRMRRTRNPVYGYTVSWVQIPPLPPLMHKPLIFKGFLLSAVVACHQLTHAVKEHLCALVNNGQYLLMSGMARPGLYNFAETNSFRSRSERNTEL